LIGEVYVTFRPGGGVQVVLFASSCLTTGVAEARLARPSSPVVSRMGTEATMSVIMKWDYEVMWDYETVGLV
jgi:hypothetical protein